MSSTEGLLNAAWVALRDCLLLQPQETVLILTDESRAPIGRALLQAARELGAPACYLEMPVLDRDGQEPPPPVAELMKGFQVVVAATERSLTHTTARREACQAGARVATMPGIQEDTMIRCLAADYYAIAARTEKLTQLLNRSTNVRVAASGGTDLRFSIQGVQAISSTGLIHKPGTFGNLPSGESYLRPLEGTAEGVLVVDGSMAGVGNLIELEEIIQIEIRQGRAVRITGGNAAGCLEALLGPVGPDAYTMAEFGIGTNDAARIIGNILEDEKVMGTIHVAFGNNISMGGQVNVPIHLDGIVQYPTVEVDGRLIMKDGKLLEDRF